LNYFVTDAGIKRFVHERRGHIFYKSDFDKRSISLKNTKHNKNVLHPYNHHAS